jgi:hypothetical protein
LTNSVPVSIGFEMGNALEKLVVSSSPLDLGPTNAIGYILLLAVNFIVGSGLYGGRKIGTTRKRIKLIWALTVF